MKFLLEHQYIKSHFNRLFKENKYLGPDRSKTWRKLTQEKETKYSDESLFKLQEIASQHEDGIDPQPCEENHHPDTIPTRRRTRSGQIYLAKTSTFQPALKKYSLLQPTIDRVISLTQSELRALQNGFAGQVTLNDFQRQVLGIKPEQLFPNIERHVLNRAAKKGNKRIRISNELKMRTNGRDITILPVKHPEKRTAENLDTLNCF